MAVGGRDRTSNLCIPELPKHTSSVAANSIKTTAVTPREVDLHLGTSRMFASSLGGAFRFVRREKVK